MKLFSIFSQSNYSFDDKKSYENVLLLLYRHWFVLAGRLIWYFFLLVLPFAIYFGLSTYLDNTRSLYWFFISVYLLIWWTSLFYIITMYLLDVWIVTDHRIIDSEQHGLFHRTVSELHLAKIQDISTDVNGPLATFLDFGNVGIQTAGTEPKFIFKQIPHPVLVKDLIMKAHNMYVSEHLNDVEVHEETGLKEAPL